MIRTTHRRFAALLLSGLLLSSFPASAQDATADPPDDEAAAAENGENKLPEIPDEPKTIDPATLMPEKLAALASVEFDDATIDEVAQWIRDEHEFPVLIDERALSDVGILLSDPVTDRLDNQPLYLLLDRLRQLGLGWYVEDDILRITTAEVAEDRMSTEQYLIGDLLDEGYEPDDLKDVIANETSGPWFNLDGIGGSIELLGDVLFVRQTNRVQLEVASLLTALREHGRMTFIFDPPQHLILREMLMQNVDAAFDSTPLMRAVQQLAEQTGADIRLDVQALRDIGVRDRQPVSLRLSGRPLDTVLKVLLSDLQLTWMLRDGVLWITGRDYASDERKTAIYDVRDLCRDTGESAALQKAIQEQTSGPWFDLDGIGGSITFAQPGAMVVRQTEAGLFELLELLETYRAALRASKPRDRNVIDPNEFITTYYRMQSDMAASLEIVLPSLIEPDSWKSDENPEGEGHIINVSSGAELRDARGHKIVGDSADADTDALVIPHTVLIIHQTRATHDAIAEIIGRVKTGDISEDLGGSGLGGGGFGGGFFSTEPQGKK